MQITAVSFVWKGKIWLGAFYGEFLKSELGLYILFVGSSYIKVHTNDILRVTYEWRTNTYEWHTSDIRVTYRYIRVTNNILLHASDIRMIFEYLTVTNEWYASTCKHRTNDIRVHRVKYQWHASDIQMTYEWQKHLELLDRILQHYLWQNRVMWFEIIFGYALF